MALEQWLPKDLKENLKLRKINPLPETEKTKEFKERIKKLEADLRHKQALIEELKQSLAIEEQRGRFKE